MRRKGLSRVVVAVTLCMLAGCGKEEPDEALVEIAVKVKRQQEEIDRITTMLEGIDKRLAEIQRSREEVSVPSTRPPSQVPLKDTPEYGKIARYISGIQEQLSDAKNQLAEARETIERQTVDLFMDRAGAWQAMGTPEQLRQRLDILAEEFSGSVGDPTLREEFAADVERLKRIFSTPRTPQQEREMARTITSEASRMLSQDETSKEWLDGQLRALDEATDPREIDARVNVTLELWKAWEVSQLARRHNVPPEMMEASGLTMSPESASYVPQEVTQGVGITPSP
jgi:DNA repair exonuclease SbcCD ATPase subunit